MTKVPRPRFDLLKVDRYASGALQYSRGCPFQCEFCDIIVIYGRQPRVKDPDQLVAELDDMRRAGFHSAFIVDDNFIGNKKKAKALLEKLIPWMEEHNYPLRLTTEASIDLADDPELLDMMYRANFRSVFIGIETPRLDSLNETKKFQNVRGDSLEAKLARIQQRRASTSTPASSSASTATTRGSSTTSSASSRKTASRWRWSACCRRFPGRRSTSGSKKEGRLVEEDPNCNFVPKQMTPRRTAPGLLGSGQAAVHARGVPRSLLQGLRVARVPRAAGRDLPQGRRRQDACRRWATDWPCCGRCSGPCCGTARCSRSAGST